MLFTYTYAVLGFKYYVSLYITPISKLKVSSLINLTERIKVSFEVIELASTISKVEERYSDLVAQKFDENKFQKWYQSRRGDFSWGYILPLLTGSNIMDLGCGLGFDSIIFAMRGYNVVGVDISAVSIDKAKRFAQTMGIADKVTFIVADINKNSIPYSFDTVFGRAILHHLTERPMKETVETIKSLLKSEGRAIFVEPLDKNPFVNVNRRFLDPYDRTPTEKPLGLTETVRAFEASFKFVEHKEFYLISPAAYVFRKIVRSPLAFNFTHRTLGRLDKYLLKNTRVLRKFAWVTIIIADDSKSIIL